MITIQLNGKAQELAEAISLEKALKTWGYDAAGFAVAINREFIPRERYPDIILQSNDQVDVVAPMQGG